MSEDSLDWLATQYVLGELSESDSEAFEERLADDLAACEAVARANRLVRVVNRALTQPKPVVQATSTQWRSRLVIGSVLTTAACLFVAAGWWSIASDPISNELAANWPVGTNSSPLELEDADEEQQEMNPDATVPDWLIAGVILETGEPTDEETKDN